MQDLRDDGGAGGGYVFGHSDRELDRLNAQARLIDPITQRIFRDGGVSTGMRVLDVDSGAGDVAFLAAHLVDDTGEVIGVDRSPIAVQTATSRAASDGVDNVSFRVGDPAACCRRRDGTSAETRVA